MAVMRVRRLLSVTFLGVSLLPGQSRALRPIEVQRRLALVVGNAEYAQGALRNPVNDARDLGAALRRLGFDVTEHVNLTQRAFEATLDAFTRRVRAGDLALFYFAGHGVQVEQENYLVPIDFRATTPIDAKYEAFAASRVRERLEATGARVRVLILDACRNNPFAFSRTLSGGLAAVRSAPAGTLVAFAAGDNQTADDNRTGRNGLFTKHLLEALAEPGIHLKEALEQTRAEVYMASGQKQLPAVYDTIVGRLVLGAASSAPPPSTPSPVSRSTVRYTPPAPQEPITLNVPQRPAPAMKDRAEYDLLQQINQAASEAAKQPLLEKHLQQYPDSQVRDLVLQSRAHGLSADGKHAAAIPLLREAVGINPGNTSAGFLLAFAIQNDSQADEQTRQAARRGALVALATPELTKDRSTVATMRRALGWIAAQENRHREAEAEYWACLQADPGQAACSYGLANAQIRQKKPELNDQALYHLARAVAHEGEGSLSATARSTVDAYLRRVVEAMAPGASVDALLQMARKNGIPPADFNMQALP